MPGESRLARIKPGWWTAILTAVIIAIIVLTSLLFQGSLKSYVPVTLTSDRTGLVMERGAKVKLRGVQVGEVDSLGDELDPVTLTLKLYPDQLRYIPANVEAQIMSTTAFGAKYVDLVMPDDPSEKRLAAGAVVHSRNVATEVNTVFQNLTDLLKSFDPVKLNAVLSAFADGVRGKGQVIGEATTDANEVLLALNPRMPAIQKDFQSLAGFSDAYGAAAQGILKILDAASTTSSTITNHQSALEALLLNVIGLANSGINTVAPNQTNLVKAINVLEPTTNLLLQYNPEYTCLLQGAVEVQKDLAVTAGGNGYSEMVDAALLLGKDPYRYPDNLPVVAAKGGPGGKPSCGSLPDVTKNFPVRYLVTNTGFGTGLDIRPNPGIGFPGWANYFPVTRAVPEPPSIRYPAPAGPAPGPVWPPGAPPYGAPQNIPPVPPGEATPPPPPPPPPSSFEGPPS
jgi:phospholipid/cholesterol/gamma-HCH transport system substrate-binding protein